MYFLSTRDNVDELRKIENKSSFVSADNMPGMLKVPLFQWKMNDSTIIMDSI